jgi:hypothetical protein
LTDQERLALNNQARHRIRLTKGEEERSLCRRLDMQVKRIGRNGPTIHIYEKLTRILREWGEKFPTTSLDPDNMEDRLTSSMYETKHVAQQIRSQIVSDLIAAGLPDWSCTHYDRDDRGPACRGQDHGILSDLRRIMRTVLSSKTWVCPFSVASATGLEYAVMILLHPLHGEGWDRVRARHLYSIRERSVTIL